MMRVHVPRTTHKYVLRLIIDEHGMHHLYIYKPQITVDVLKIPYTACVQTMHIYVSFGSQLNHNKSIILIFPLVN